MGLDRGPITHAQGVGWQHGEVPAPPTKLTKVAKEAWEIWFGSWFAWFWGPEDLPGIRQMVRLYDRVERGEFQRHAEMRVAMDTYGITPKGHQDRRWRPPQEAKPVPSNTSSDSRWGDLKVADGA